MTDFTTIGALLTFTGMVLAVVLLTQGVKKLFNIEGRDKIQWIVFGWAIFFCIIAAILQGDWSTSEAIVSTILVWFVNAFIVWFTAEKSFEKVTKTQTEGSFILDQSNDDTDRFKLDLGSELATVGSKKYITLKVDTETKLE